MTRPHRARVDVLRTRERCARRRVSYATVRAAHPQPRRYTPSSILTKSNDLEVELGAAPVAALGVVPDGSRKGGNVRGQRVIDRAGNPKNQ